MNQTYSHILTFWIKHRYFSDGLFKSVNISFAEGSKKIINNLELIIKPFAGGFNLLASNPELLNSLNDIHPLQIYLDSKDPLYINYTELPPYSLRDNLIYFNNLSITADAENESFSLHKDKYASKNEIVLICNGNISIPDYNPEINYRFTDAKGNEIPSESVRQTSNNSGSFNISGIEQGLVRIFSASEEIQRVYYQPNAIWKKPIGIVELYTTELFKTYKASGRVDYSVCFDNRKTTWKYFFTDKNILKKSNLGIINKDKKQIFLPPQVLPVNQNLNALVFESKIKIPLFEFSDDNFQLVDQSDPKKAPGIPVLKSLPKASSKQLFTDPSKSPENVYSHIYI